MAITDASDCRRRASNFHTGSQHVLPSTTLKKVGRRPAIPRRHRQCNTSRPHLAHMAISAATITDNVKCIEAASPTTRVATDDLHHTRQHWPDLGPSLAPLSALVHIASTAGAPGTSLITVSPVLPARSDCPPSLILHAPLHIPPSVNVRKFSQSFVAPSLHGYPISAHPTCTKKCHLCVLYQLRPPGQAEKQERLRQL